MGWRDVGVIVSAFASEGFGSLDRVDKGVYEGIESKRGIFQPIAIDM